MTHPTLVQAWASDGSYRDYQTLAGATVEAGEDSLTSCGSVGGLVTSASLWYALTPTRSGTLYASTEDTPSNDDTVLAIYSSPPSSSAPVACNDDISGGNYRSNTSASLTAGTTYYVEVATWAGTVPDPEPVLALSGDVWTSGPAPPKTDGGALAEREARVASRLWPVNETADGAEAYFCSGASDVVPVLAGHRYVVVTSITSGSTLHPTNDTDAFVTIENATGAPLVRYRAGTMQVESWDDARDATLLRDELAPLPHAAGAEEEHVVALAFNATSSDEATGVRLSCSATARLPLSGIVYAGGGFQSQNVILNERWTTSGRNYTEYDPYSCNCVTGNISRLSYYQGNFTETCCTPLAMDSRGYLFDVTTALLEDGDSVSAGDPPPDCPTLEISAFNILPVMSPWLIGSALFTILMAIVALFWALSRRAWRPLG